MNLDGFKIGLNAQSGAEVRLIEDHLADGTNGYVTNEDKIESLFKALRMSIFNYLVAAFGRDHAIEAEDITQDAFLQLHRVMQKGQRIDNPRAWLFRVAHNMAINRLKTRQFIAPLDDLGWDEICLKIPDPGITPEQRAQRLEDFALVHEAMKRLSLRERQCLHLRAEGLRYSEIAEILEISASGVGKYLRRAIKKLLLENLETHAD